MPVGPGPRAGVTPAYIHMPKWYAASLMTRIHTQIRPAARMYVCMYRHTYVTRRGLLYDDLWEGWGCTEPQIGTATVCVHRASALRGSLAAGRVWWVLVCVRADTHGVRSLCLYGDDATLSRGLDSRAPPIGDVPGPMQLLTIVMPRILPQAAPAP